MNMKTLIELSVSLTIPAKIKDTLDGNEDREIDKPLLYIYDVDDLLDALNCCGSSLTVFAEAIMSGEADEFDPGHAGQLMAGAFIFNQIMATLREEASPPLPEKGKH